ncbi:MAG: cytochrome ubiquinol oxidase subunit I [Steroidobacteraceae bacterium]
MADFTVVDLSRLQFAITALFHILWPVLTIGLSLFLIVTETLWLRTGEVAWYHHCRFWGRLFLLNFGVGVVTGLPLEFEFGTNWATFSQVAGGFFGNMLGFEGAMAFMLEAGFLGIMMFGWQRVPRAMHLVATSMVAFGGSLSAFWILVANSWMQTPTGGHMVNGHYVVTSYLRAIFNPDMPWGVSHMWVACLETSLFVVGGASAWHLLKGRNVAFFRKSLLLAAALAVIATPLQIYLGDGSGKSVFKEQPAKGAAIEGHWNTNPPGQPAAWALLAWPDKAEQRNDWQITIPGVLSWLATGSPDGRVIGLHAFPPRDQPPVLPLIFYAFRIMAAIGVALFLLALWTAWTALRRRLGSDTITAQKWLLRAWVAAIPLGYVAVDMGWITREVGRQPWIIYDLLRTSAAVSNLPVASVAFTTLGYFLIDSILLVSFVIFGYRIIRKGPDFSLPVPRCALRASSAVRSTGSRPSRCWSRWVWCSVTCCSAPRISS